MDRRIEETRGRLVKALRALMIERAWADITVAMICKKANVARSTYYAHLNDKAELMALSISVLAQELAVPGANRGLDLNGTFCFLEPWLAHVKTHQGIWMKNRDTAAANVIAENLRRTLEALAQREVSGSRFSGQVTQDGLRFVCGGITSLVEHWLAGGCQSAESTLLNVLDRHVLAAAVPGSAG